MFLGKAFSHSMGSFLKIIQIFLHFSLAFPHKVLIQALITEL